jgi:hypothetical protein
MWQLVEAVDDELVRIIGSVLFSDRTRVVSQSHKINADATK